MIFDLAVKPPGSHSVSSNSFSFSSFHHLLHGFAPACFAKHVIYVIVQLALSLDRAIERIVHVRQGIGQFIDQKLVSVTIVYLLL